MKHTFIFKLAGVVLGMSTAEGSLLESAKQNATTGISTQYEKYSIYTREQVLAGEARGDLLARITMAREMLAGDEALDKVMRYTKLSREEIEALQRGEQLPIEGELEATFNEKYVSEEEA
ncbi:MAG: hypothetical protein H6492_00585 [Candidatus Paracaedibacteraceae bacterium]|nr:hypothetical protein [Candidatus Paracaedibacteraceae bacterium]